LLDTAMPIVAIELTDEEIERLDSIAKDEKRARKHQAAISLMDRVDQILADNSKQLEAQP
jgi:predicted transcriptional regulator